MRGFAVLALAILTVGLGLSGLMVSQAGSTDSTELVAASREPRTLDPHIGADAGSWRVVANVYEALVAFKRGTLDLEPALAEKWSVSPDGRTFTFTLRRNVKFHDGTEFDANAVKVNFSRLKTINQGPAYVLSEYKETSVMDKYTVRIVLNRPVGTFLAMLPRVLIASPKAIRDNDKGDNAQGWLRDHAVGTGPYRFVSWTPGQDWVIEKFDGYWQGWPQRHITKVTLKFISDIATQRLMLERGDLDIAALYSVDDLPALRANTSLQVFETDSIIQLYLPMVTHRKPLSDVRVRRAVAQTFDYQTHARASMAGLAKPAVGFVPPQIPYHNKNAPMFRYDIDAAKRLLAEAGFPSGGFTLSYHYVQGLEEERRAGELLQQGLAQLGIRLDIRPLAWPTVLGEIQDPDRVPDLYAFYIYPAYADPDAYLYQQFHSSQQRTSYNGMYYKNGEVDRLLDDAVTTLDGAKRTAMYSRLEQVLFDDAVAIPVSIPRYVLPMRAWVRNFKYTPTWNETYLYYGMYLLGKPGR